MEFEEGKTNMKENKVRKFESASKALKGKNKLPSERYKKENYYFYEETPYKFNWEYYTFECKGYFPSSLSYQTKISFQAS